MSIAKKKSIFIKFALISSLAFAFVACSSKVQTNKIPDDKKWNLPYNKQIKKQELNAKYVSEFEIYVQDFFSNSKSTACNNCNNEKSIYEIGLDRGYFNE